jgi:hypothetical protein
VTGGRNQENCSSKPFQENSLRPYLEKNLSQKRGGGMAQGVGLEFKKQYHRKEKKKKECHMVSNVSEYNYHAILLFSMYQLNVTCFQRILLEMSMFSIGICFVINKQKNFILASDIFGKKNSYLGWEQIAH